ncbi:hypothetical protein AB0I55_23845 [Actinocatenispora sera]|uniref:hypothetical protein n=1 Tax=Actinocatenispora sera TaxID=390989 RepID=UPI0033F7D234
MAIPTGLVTGRVGAVFLIALAIRSRDTGQAAQLPAGRLAARRRVAIVLDPVLPLVARAPRVSPGELPGRRRGGAR